MALFLGHTKAAVKMIGAEFKQIAFIANMITQLAMLGYLTYAWIVNTGIWYVNAALLAVSVGYFIFTICTHFSNIKKETKKSIQSTFKWIKRILKLFPLSIALYSLFLAPNHLTALSLISPIVITVAWLLDVLITILYHVLESRLDLLMEGIAADLGNIPILGKKVKEATGKGIGNTDNEQLQALQEMASADEEEWNERLRLEKEQNSQDSFFNKIKRFLNKSDND